jgi:hypothetical protein
MRIVLVLGVSPGLCLCETVSYRELAALTKTGSTAD